MQLTEQLCIFLEIEEHHVDFFYRLKTIKKELKEREFKLATKAAWKELEKEERKSLPKKLGKLSYEEPTIAVKLSDELVDSLRVLKVSMQCFYSL